jgi:hypothetical protein
LNGFTQLEVGADSVPGPAGGTIEDPTPQRNHLFLAVTLTEQAAQELPTGIPVEVHAPGGESGK